ncbi:MAG: phosphoglycerate kinase [Candidatus Moraniibacteriota bacterium]|nr:MAG: phosphoglycerate kinase [Candidatus Moranbacteria bacterium]
MNQYESVKNISVEGKNVLVRVDFNVNLKDGDVRQKYKMEAAKETIMYLLKNGARTISLLSHLGRPEGRYSESDSLAHIADDVRRILGVWIFFVGESVGDRVKEAIASAEKGNIFLLENVRFHAEEEKNDKAFSALLSEPFDIFVNDAFSVCHRAHASTVGITKHIPTYAGIYLEKEIEILSNIRKGVDSPSVAIVGGAKIETKLPLITMFSKTFDKVLVGGKVANEAIDGNIELSENVILPIDFEGDRFDIGEKTREIFCEKIKNAKTIVWNGPLGMFEDARFAKGTVEIARAIGESSAFSVIGGGESIEVLEDMKLLGAISFVSTGGGAMLEYLTGASMPGLEALLLKKN